MTMLFPTTCCISGVRGWNVNHSVTLIGSLPTAGVMVLHPGPGAGRMPSPPRGPLGTPLPAVGGAGVKNQPQLAGGSGGEPAGTPLFGVGALGPGVAPTPAAACPPP